jgi:hypothetical protein
MGEAKERARAYEQAKARVLQDLEGEALIVAKTAITVFEKFILPGRHTAGCYLITMVLNRFLATEHGIVTDPVVGYVNDGTDDIMISHAWLEHNGLKTDLTLNILDPYLGAEPGSLLVQDYVLRTGVLDYSYHRNRTAPALLAIQGMLRDPALTALVRHKEVEHQEMLARSRTPLLMNAFLDAAPPGLSYDEITAVLR